MQPKMVCLDTIWLNQTDIPVDSTKNRGLLDKIWFG